MSRATPTRRVECPVAPGDRLRVPAGARVHSMHPAHDSPRRVGRTYAVTVHHVSDGYVDVDDHHGRGRGFVVLPEVVWPGTGGYWQTLRLTPEICAANDVTVPALPDLRPETDDVDVTPSYGEGYDNRLR